MFRNMIAFVAGAALCAAARAQTPAALRGQDAPANGMWIDSLDLSYIQQDYGRPRRAHSVDRKPIELDGVRYDHGIGTHANGEFDIDLKGAAVRFEAMAGVDDERRGQGSVRFHVIVDGKDVADSPVQHGGDRPHQFSVDLSGAKRLALEVDDGGDGISNDHADWAGAVLILEAGAAQKPEAATPPKEPPPPIAMGTQPAPRINNPKITGATPGRPFLFMIPATGQGPLTFSASGLPQGLTLDANTGIISGTLEAAGQTVVDLTVKGARGTAASKLTIVGGAHKLALTPPMGWNSWNVWAGEVDDQKIRDAADAMVKSGLAAHGFQYINIDDTWEDGRDAQGNIESNKKFPDMKALAAYVHSKGLKLGIYSSPGPKTCAGYEGSYKHEVRDAVTYGQWGVDYLKYDWCSYGRIAKGHSVAELQKPYYVMRHALDQSSRDIVYSLCQYGMGDVWTWGAKVGGNCWRTTGDIRDNWGSMSSIGFSQSGHEKYAGPGHWNDPDMLVVGLVGWGHPHPSHLTPSEQVTHITLWCLQSAPLLIGCDMTKLDTFTTALLGNDEVLAVDQDPLGKPAGRKWKQGPLEVWSRPLADGTTAVGLFNRGSGAAQVTARWSDLGIRGEQPVRDLWQQKDAGTANDAYTATVPRHGAVLVKIGKPAQG